MAKMLQTSAHTLAYIGPYMSFTAVSRWRKVNPALYKVHSFKCPPTANAVISTFPLVWAKRCLAAKHQIIFDFYTDKVALYHQSCDLFS